MVMMPGMIIDQRRPMWSAVQPQNPLARKARKLAMAIGTATCAGLKFRSFCRCVANSDQIE